MNYELMEVELTKAFIKAVDLDDYNSMFNLNVLNKRIVKYRKNKDYPMLRVYYKKAIDIMANNDYMYLERQRIRRLLWQN